MVAVKEDGRLARGEATRQKVLDAAERLFAEHGFDGVSIRQIAQEAEVTLGVVGFHSGNKVELFTTILERRASALNEARLDALEELRRNHDRRSMQLAEIMRAYIAPYIDLASTGGPQWHAYACLIARIVSDERWYPLARRLYDPTARIFLDAIREAHPAADNERLAAAFVMSVASMLSVVASTVRIGVLSGKEEAAARPDPAELCNVLIEFCSGGIERAVLGA